MNKSISQQPNECFARTLFRHPLLMPASLAPASGRAQAPTRIDGHDGAFNPTDNVVINTADPLDGVLAASKNSRNLSVRFPLYVVKACGLRVNALPV